MTDAIATGYREVDAILRILLNGVREVLGADFVGLYLYGSLSSGDFDPASSDIDFLVVTRTELAAVQLAALANMHARIKNSMAKFADQLEGSYIPAAAVRRYDPKHSEHPSIGVDWEFGINPHGWNWVLERAIIRESGKALAGPAPTELIDPVSPDDLKVAVQHQLLDFWANIGTPDWLNLAAYQAFSILTMCRALHTLSTGTMTTKPKAASWAMDTLGAPWSNDVVWAMAHRHEFTPHNSARALEFIRHALDLARDR